MGTWGPGIVQSDQALDFIGGIMIERLIHRIIVFHLADESLTDWPSDGYAIAVAAAEILALWCEKYNKLPDISRQVIRRWREICLHRFEADEEWDNTVTPDGLDARTERRKVIESTFDRLEAVAMDE